MREFSETFHRRKLIIMLFSSVLGVTVNNQEIFIIEGPRSVIRIAPDPDPYAEGERE